MKNKIIIHNYTDLNDIDVIGYVYKVIEEGKVSETKYGKQYCFATRIGNFIITCDRRKNTYTFKIFKKE